MLPAAQTCIPGNVTMSIAEAGVIHVRPYGVRLIDDGALSHTSQRWGVPTDASATGAGASAQQRRLTRPKPRSEADPGIDARMSGAKQALSGQVDEGYFIVGQRNLEGPGLR
jgi:hypothetical protein